jgi:hypothetical protein
MPEGPPSIRPITRGPRHHWFGYCSFFSPPEYRGESRCDLHPRYRPDGRSIVVDSVHGGDGRQMYLIDISSILEEVAR